MTICKKCLHGVVCLASDVRTLVCNQFKDSSRYIELPCKVGDVVYYVMDLGLVHGQVLESKVLRIEIQDEMRFYAKTVKHYRYNYLWFDSADLGKTVFLSREDAENALKEREDR